jgi:hypothetical protein
MEPRESWEVKIADRVPGFTGQPPPRPGASLSDWYAWSLARHEVPFRRAVRGLAEEVASFETRPTGAPQDEVSL